MQTQKQLTQAQLSFINDLFTGQFDEQPLLEKHQISLETYVKWQAEEAFIEELRARMESAHLQSELIIARYSSLAAAKLVQLTDSENQETARKACLDIITLPGSGAKKNKEKPGETYELDEPVSAETAAKILSVLADGEIAEK